MSFFRLHAAAVLVIAALASPLQAQDSLSAAQQKALLAEAKQLVLQNQMQQAFELLSPHELALAGNNDFDYLYGTAALDSGHADLAIFALERVLDQRPSFSGARIELARAYFNVGDNETARYHFEYLQGENPPPNVQQAITSYLRAIDRLASSYKSIHLPNVAGGFGWDSNANASTQVEQFLGFALDGNNVETDSPYYFASLGDYYSRPLTPDLKLVLTGAVSQRNYPDASFVDSTDVNGNAALEWNYGDTKVIATGGLALNWLDGDDNLDRYIGDVLVTHSLNDDWKLLGGVTAAAHRFTNDLEIRDADIYNGRVGVEHYLNPSRGSVLSGMLMFGTDSTTDSDSPFDNDRWALAASGSTLLMPRVLLGVSAGYKNTDYNGRFFSRPREDDQWNAAVSLQLFDWPAQGWRMIGRVGYTDVDSNLDLYTYDRTEAGLTFYRAFE
ncbi:MAG: tetratricopeptide repeat protein [Halieaceae bacterium]